MKKFLLIILILFCSKSYSQSISGVSGLIDIPNARIMEDGSLIIGGGLIPRGYFKSTSGLYQNKYVNPGLSTYVTYAILPFTEISFGYTHEIGAKVSRLTRYFPDRQFSIKIRLFEEKQFLPQLALGFNDFGNLLKFGASNYFVANYFVMSKRLKVQKLNFDFSIGRTFDINTHKSDYLKGFFYGVILTAQNDKSFKLLIVNNNNGLKIAISKSFFKKFNLMIGTWDLKKPTFSFKYII